MSALKYCFKVSMTALLDRLDSFIDSSMCCPQEEILCDPGGHCGYFFKIVHFQHLTDSDLGCCIVKCHIFRK